MHGIIEALRAVEKHEGRVRQLAEQAPASPGPNADITKAKEAMQGAIDNLNAVFEGAGYTINSTKQQQLADLKRAEIAQARAKADEARQRLAVQQAMTQKVPPTVQRPPAAIAPLKPQERPQALPSPPKVETVAQVPDKPPETAPEPLAATEKPAIDKTDQTAT